MTLVLRKSRTQARIEGWDQRGWSEDDYVVVDDTVVGRIYKEMIHGEPKWRWFLQTVPAPPPNSGMADTLEEAKAAFKERYEQLGRGSDRPQRAEFRFCLGGEPFPLGSLLLGCLRSIIIATCGSIVPQMLCVGSCRLDKLLNVGHAEPPLRCWYVGNWRDAPKES